MVHLAHGGGARGGMWLSRLHPTVLTIGFLSTIGVLLSLNPSVLVELLLMIIVTGFWCALFGGSARSLAMVIGYGAVTFLPIFLLAPWIGGGDLLFSLPFGLEVREEGALIPLRIIFRGVSCLLVSASLFSAVRPVIIALGLAKIPFFPAILATMIYQILHWAEILITEAASISRAISLRSGGGSGPWVLARSLPLVWFPRLILRAERVTAAMELRGYQGELPEILCDRLGSTDAAALCFSAVVVTTAIAFSL